MQKQLVLNLNSLQKSKLYLQDYIILQLIYEGVNVRELKIENLEEILENLQTAMYIRLFDDLSIEPRQKLIDLFKKTDVEKDVDEVLIYLNNKAGKRFNVRTNANRSFVKGRFNENYTKDDLKQVVDVMCEEWKGTNMEMYLRPETLFNASKFQTYINKTSKTEGVSLNTMI